MIFPRRSTSSSGSGAIVPSGATPNGKTKPVAICRSPAVVYAEQLTNACPTLVTVELPLPVPSQVSILSPSKSTLIPSIVTKALPAAEFGTPVPITGGKNVNVTELAVEGLRSLPSCGSCPPPPPGAVSPELSELLLVTIATALPAIVTKGLRPSVILPLYL